MPSSHPSLGLSVFFLSFFSGFFSSEGECELPETLESVRGVAANGCAVSTVALLCVAPQGEGGACRVKLRLMVEAPGVVLRPQQQLTEQAQRRPPDWVAYTDGSEDLGKAGWAYTVLIGGDAIGDRGASLASEGYGPVVTSAAHPAYLGARKHTNNTAELTGRPARNADIRVYTEVGGLLEVWEPLAPRWAPRMHV